MAKRLLSCIIILVALTLSKQTIAQSVATTTITFSGFQGCGGCTVCGADYYCFNTLSSYCGNTAPCGTKTFIDPVPAGNIVTSVLVGYYSADCSGGSLSATINGNAVPTVNEGNTGCACSNNPCGISASSSSNFPCGLPGYNNGGSNSLQLCTGANVCINKLTLTLTYAPANQATPATQPGAISGSTVFCAGMAQTYSIPAVANAASYTWTVPAGWTINSGQGTTSINVTPGSSGGSICVKATNLCGTSPQTCLTVVPNTPSSAPTSASANPTSVCGSGTTTLTLAGGSLGTGATWQWYSGSCGGTSVGSGSSIIVSASSTTTYYVRAVGTCNTTTCASVTFTVNPIPTANAGSPAVLTCANTSTTLAGSGGGTYSWTGPGIVSGGSTANPVINQPGSYSLTVTSAGCNSVPSVVTVTQNTTAPTVTVSGTQTITCASTSASLSGSATPSTCTPVWTGGVCAGSTSYNATACSAGNYTLTVTNPANGCTSSAVESVVSSNNIPAATASNSGSITCTTTTAQVVATTTSTPVSYTWSGPGAVSGAATSTGTVSVAGTYQCVITNTLTGCSTTVTTNVPSNTTPVAASIAPTGSITCTTTTLALSASPTGANYNYNWTGTGIVSGGTTATPVVNQGGNYSVVITNTINGCTGNANITVPTNTTSPTVSVSPSSYTTSCASPTVQLTANSSDPGVTYSWTSPGTGSLNNSGIANPIASGSGVFTVVVTSTATGCSSAASPGTATVVPDANVPSISMSASTLSITCVTTTVSVAVTSTPTPLSYSWSPNPLSGGSTSNPVFDTPGTYSVVATNTVNGCSTNGNVAVVMDTVRPTIAIAPGNVIDCANLTSVINATIAASGPTVCVWSGPGITGSPNNAGVTVNQAGTYTISVTNTSNGCVNTDTSSVSTNTVAPTATVTTVSTNSVISCSAPSVSLTVNTTPASGLTYNWTPGGSTAQTIVVSNAGAGGVTVLNTANGCSVTVPFSVSGSTTAPVVSTPNGSIACGATSSTLSASSTNTNVVYSWTGPNAGSIISGGNSANPVIADAGTYTVTSTDTISGCFTTSTVSVVQTNVQAAFTANPVSGIAPLVVNFTNQSVGATSFTWVFGDGSPNSTATDPSNTFTTGGTYVVMLIASASPCADTAYMTIVVSDGLTLEIPNVFTPNNDSINDIFTIKSTGVKEISLQIFNRWGEKLFEFTGPKAGWDGKTGQGSTVPDGTYFYFVKATGFDGKVIDKDGTVNLYR
ncbi:MAG: gliding motility-associated C-terminal domain-containing protein [Bacteroidetes bacterium]|nr:gliding motility-associated C-terminal domain-containing protein [Bacteroidota bacterium]